MYCISGQVYSHLHGDALQYLRVALYTTRVDRAIRLRSLLSVRQNCTACTGQYICTVPLHLHRQNTSRGKYLVDENSKD